MRKVYAYARVSTDEQAEHGSSLKDQAVKICAFANANGIEIIEHVVDAGECSKTLDRPGLKRILAGLRSGEARGIVVAHTDRLTRHAGDMIRLVEEFFLSTGPDECHLYSASESIETRTASGRLQLFLMAVVGMFAREKIVENTVTAMAGKRTRGERMGQVPFGYSPAADGGKTLVPNPEELQALVLMRGLADRKWTMKAIAAELDRLGFRPKQGGATWSRSSVGQILARYYSSHSERTEHGNQL